MCGIIHTRLYWLRNGTQQLSRYCYYAATGIQFPAGVALLASSNAVQTNPAPYTICYPDKTTDKLVRGS